MTIGDIKQNVKVAEFLGFQKDKLGWCDVDEVLPGHVIKQESGNTFDSCELKFQKSWDWLMVAIEKCYDTELPAISDNDNITGDITHALVDCDIEEAFKQVLIFINAINKSKNDKNTFGAITNIRIT